MKLITFDNGRVGRLELEERLVLPLEVHSTRGYFERDGKVLETGERLPLDDVTLRAPIVPKKFFHTSGNFREHETESKNVDWSHPMHKGIVFFQNVDAIVGPEEPVIYPEHLTSELDYELEIAVVIGKPGKFFGVDDAPDHIMRLRRLQRHHRPRHPAPRDGVRRLLLLQGHRHLLPRRPVHRHRRRDPRPPEPRHGTAGQRRGPAEVQHQPHVGLHPAPGRLPLPAGLQRRRPHHHRNRPGRGGFSGDPDMYLKPGDVVEAEVERLGVLRTPIVSWQEGHGTPVPAKVDW